MEPTSESKSIVEALDRLLLATPEVSDLRAAYRSVVDRPAEERVAWIRDNASEDLVSELSDICFIPELGLDSGDVVYSLIEAMVSTDESAETSGVLQTLLGPSVVRQELPNGTPYLVTVIHQFTDLDELFEEIRREHQQTFPAIGIRPATIDEIAFVAP